MFYISLNRENSTSKEPKSSQPPEKKSKTLAEAKSNVTSVAKPPPKAKVIAPLPKRTLLHNYNRSSSSKISTRTRDCETRY